MRKIYPLVRLRHSLVTLPKVNPLPAGYVLREAKTTDDVALSAALEASFGDPWPVERVRKALLDDPRVPVTFVIEKGGIIVGTASYQEKNEPDPNAGWLHWVAVRPEERGQGLGQILSRRVLDEAVSRGRSCVMLTTADIRYIAMKMYIGLGFAPNIGHWSHPKRWRNILREIEKLPPYRT